MRISPSQSGRRDVLLVVMGAGLLLLYSAPWMINGYATAVTPFLALCLLASAAWGAAIWRVMKTRSGAGDGSLFIIIAFSILFRAVVLPQESILDDDLYRYVWDGRVWLGGVNPYLFPPNHYALSSLRDADIFPHINFPYVPTIYPPLAQFVFAGSVGIFGSALVGMKFFFTLFDMLTIAAVTALLKELGIDPRRVIVYAWSPLAVKEVAGSGHLDSLAVMLTVIAVWLAARRPSWSAAALGAAVAAKLYPLAIAPFFIRRLGWRFLIAPAVALFAYAPFLSIPPGKIFAGFFEYMESWMFNPGFFDVLRRALALVTENNMTAAKIIAALIVGGVIVWRKTRDDGTHQNLSESAAWTLAALLLVAPTADPWYLLWLLPFLCVTPVSGLLLWMGLSFLSYGFYYENRDIAWLRLIEYAPVYALLAWEAARAARCSRRAQGL